MANPTNNDPSSAATTGGAAEPVNLAKITVAAAGLSSPLITTGDPDALAMAAALSAVNAAFNSIKQILEAPIGSSKSHVTHPPIEVLKAMDAITALLKVRPALALEVDPSELAATADGVRATLAFLSLIKALQRSLEGTLEVKIKAGYTDLRSVYHIAKRLALSDRTIASGIAPAAALFARPKRVDSAVVGAALKDLRARKANNRAANAASDAAAAKDRADKLMPEVLAAPGSGGEDPNSGHQG